MSLVTWAHRIGVNYLLNLRRKTPLEQMAITFDKFGEDLAAGLATRDTKGPTRKCSPKRYDSAHSGGAAVP